jgi:hypothetical protein
MLGEADGARGEVQDHGFDLARRGLRLELGQGDAQLVRRVEGARRPLQPVRMGLAIERQELLALGRRQISKIVVRSVAGIGTL